MRRNEPVVLLNVVDHPWFQTDTDYYEELAKDQTSTHGGSGGCRAHHTLAGRGYLSDRVGTKEVAGKEYAFCNQNEPGETAMG